MRFVYTDKAPAPAGHYSQAIIHNDLIYVSGQLPIDPKTDERKIGTIEEQTKQALANLEQILKAVGSDLSQVLRTTVYVDDITLWDRVNEVYADMFGDHRPARTVVPIKDLHFGFQIEIDAIAAQISDLGH